MKQLVLALMLAVGVPKADTKPDSSYEGTENVVSMVLTVDVSCILKSWRIVGVFACPSPRGGATTCLIVENAYPVGIVEAVRRPFTSHMAEAETLFKVFQDAPRFGETSSHTNGAGDGTKLQFSEAHAFEFVPDLLLAGQLPLAKPRGELFRISYLSEIDGYSWRNGLADFLTHPQQVAERAALPSCSTVPRAGDCAWSWGPWFPRIGFTVHPSEVMAAHLIALRAGRVGSDPAGRMVISRYPYEPRSGHYIQMVRPTRRSCVSIGWPVVRQIERGALSLNGAYLMIHFGIFQECKGCFPARLAEPRPPTG